MQSISYNEDFIDQLTPIQPRLYKIAFCYVKNEAEALEIVSQSIYRAYLAYPDLKKREYFATWIIRIVINESISLVRKRKKIVPIEEHEATITASSTLNLEPRMDLYDALDKLSATDRSYIILKYFEDMTFREIAAATGKSENTIKTKIYRILKVLKAELNDMEVCSYD